MFSLRHYNRNTTWFIILFSPTINSFFLWKICRCWKEKRQYLPVCFFISFFLCLKLPSWPFWEGEVGRHWSTPQPDTPRSPTSEPRARLQPWLLAIALKRDGRHVPRAHSPGDISASSPVITKPFQAEGRQWERRCPSPAAPSHPSPGMQEPTSPSYLRQSRSD